MLKHTLIATILTSATLVSSGASADWYFQPKIGYEFRSFEFESGDLEGTATIPGFILGFSVVNSSGFYFDFDFSGGEDEVSDFYPEDDYIERFDLSLSAGYSLGSGYTIFGGFNETDTQIENHKNQVNQPVDYQIISSGLFLGLAKTFTLDKTSSITTSIAAGKMSGEYESTDTALDPLDGEGESVGYSASASYTKRFDKIAVSAGVKTQSYTYSDMKTFADGSDLPDASDKMTSFFVKTSYTF